jgi:hypothetical protein
MKLFLVILALVAVSFVVLIGYGAGRDGEGSSTSWFGRAPQSGGARMDEDDVEGWTPPPAVELIAPFVQPFAPPFAVSRPVTRIEGGSAPDLAIAASTERFRIARVTLTEGTSAVVTGDTEDDDRDPAVLCLCRPGALVAEAALAQCGARWKEKRRQTVGGLTCRDGDDKGSLPFGPAQGRMSFAASEPATVEVK